MRAIYVLIKSCDSRYVDQVIIGDSICEYPSRQTLQLLGLASELAFSSDEATQRIFHENYPVERRIKESVMTRFGMIEMSLSFGINVKRLLQKLPTANVAAKGDEERHIELNEIYNDVLKQYPGFNIETIQLLAGYIPYESVYYTNAIVSPAI